MGEGWGEGDPSRAASKAPRPDVSKGEGRPMVQATQAPAMVHITLNGVSVEAQPGRRLVEVIKEQGVSITNLCYIDGLEPYAGCRTCIVEIEGARPTPLQLSCIAQVTDGMVVNTETDAV